MDSKSKLNRDWFKVLGSLIIVVVLTLGTFFLFRKFLGEEYIVANTSTSIALVFFIIAAILAQADDVALTGLAASIIINVPVISRNFTAHNTIVVFVVIAVVVSGISSNIAKGYDLPKWKVAVTYILGTALIFFPIYLWG